MRHEHGSRSAGDDDPHGVVAPFTLHRPTSTARSASYSSASARWGGVRTAQALGFDADLWASVDAVTGVCERSFDLVTAALLAETMGRYLAPIPFVEYVVARRAFDGAGSPVPDGVLSLTVSNPPGRLVPAGAVADHVLSTVDGVLVDLADAPPGRVRRNLADLPLADRRPGGCSRGRGATADPSVHARAVANGSCSRRPSSSGSRLGRFSSASST